jgi:isopropylmalate/homocitrate/citramalate synthase
MTTSPVSAAIVARATSRRGSTTLVQAQAEAALARGEASKLAEEGRQRIHTRFTCWDVHREAVIGTAAVWLRTHSDENLAKGRAILEHAAEQMLAVGLLVSTRLKKGSPLDILKEEARMCEADCVVVGARGFNSTLEALSSRPCGLAQIPTVALILVRCFEILRHHV